MGTGLSKDEATFLVQNGNKIIYEYNDNPFIRPVSQGEAGFASHIIAPDRSKLNKSQVHKLLKSGGFNFNRF